MKSPLRIGVLIGHSLAAPLPEAVEMAKDAVNTLTRSELNLDVWVDVASVRSLRRLDKEGCELLLYYGHGTEVGRLVFVDGEKTFPELSTGLGLEAFWKSLKGTMLFACHSQKFASALPCPWLAFTEEILRLAPKGFMHAWTQALKELPLDAALQRAHSECQDEMDSNFADSMEFSALPWPKLPVAAGQVRLRRASPGLANRLEVDFASVVLDGRSYPEHDPFVGRGADLLRLSKLPNPNSDQPLQQLVWVSGDAGMGKSALLRQHACNVRDLAFADEEEPVWLLHAYCQNCIQPRDVEQILCGKAKELYEWEAVPETFHQLFKLLQDVPGAHVWILDDLTYLREEIGKEQDSLNTVRTIADAAYAAAIPLQLVASARFGGPRGWKSIKAEPLNDGEAVALAGIIQSQAGLGTTSQDQLDVRRLFAQCGGSTVHFKRALILAVDTQKTFGAIADELSTSGATDATDQDEFSKKLVEFEVRQLNTLAHRHGFNYRTFLEVYWPLILRAGYFSSDELQKWFPTEFHVAESTIIRDRAYANGLAQLVRLGFVATRREADGDVLYMPPNQRVVMKALADGAHPLPQSIPFRAPKARLSSALERAKKGQREAIGEILALEQEYAKHVAEPEAAETVIAAMMIRAELAQDMSGDLAVSLGIYDDVVTRFGTRDEPALAEQVAKALVNKGVRLGQLGRSEDALVVYDDVVTRFGTRDEPALAEQVAKALAGKALTLWQLERRDEAVATAMHTLTRFGDRPEQPIQDAVTLCRQILELSEDSSSMA
ncbi:MAG: ATP-binding protein [Planctomycetaceae bacterium]|nr:ATP-binding protein [Planctomycetaceae bacterium]